jgi:hypothetical protein
MKTIASFILLAAMFVAGTAFAADPVIGMWKLNVEKSKFSAGHELKAATRTYSEADGVYTLEQTMMGADGKETSSTAQYSNGKDVKQQGQNPALDTTHATKVNANTWNFQLKKDGKVVGRVHRVVSADGKTLTVHNTGTQLSGANVDETLVYDRQ